MGSGGSALLRWACLAVLSAALLLTLPMQAPRYVEFGHLLDEVRTGQVTSVQVKDESGSIEVKWHEGPLRWYRAAGPADGRTQLMRAGTTAGSRGLSFSTPQSHRVWVQQVTDADEPSVLAVAAGILWLATFFGMLFTRDHSYANRWAWFWLFVVGGIGPILIIFKEPEPLLVRPGRLRPAPITGGVGFGLAVLWAIGLSLVGSGLNALVR